MRQMNQMPYIIGVVIHIYPSNKQKRIIAKNDGAARFIYNRLVARDRELHALERVKRYCEPVAVRISYLKSLGTNLSDLKAAYPFLEDKEIDSRAVCNAKQNYQAAWNNFMKVSGTSIPTFHKKGYSKSYQTNCQYHSGCTDIKKGSVRMLDRKHVQIPKLGSVKFKDSGMLQRIFARTSETRIGSVKVAMDNCGDYWISMQVGSVCPFHNAMPAVGHGVGIDVNVKNLYTDSDGNEAENPKFYTKTEKKLAKAQRKLSRRMECAKKDGRSLCDAKNYQKQRLKTAKISRSVSRRRKDYLNVQSKRLVESQDFIFTENLSSKAMMKDNDFAKYIADVAWNKFITMIKYKCGFYGRIFGRVPAKNTTQMCHVCGFILTGDSKLSFNDRSWICPNCGTFHMRDHNSAINIKNSGTRLYLSNPAL